MTRTSPRIALSRACLVLGGAAVAYACGSSATLPGEGNNGSSSGSSGGSSGSSSGSSGLVFDGGGLSSSSSGGSSGGSSSGGPCVNLQCQVHSCASGVTTTITGKIYDPAGKNPLYDIVVYVPNAKLSALPSGASCDSCESLYSGDPISATLTDATGAFTLTNVPDGDNIPIVVQVGKWRKQYTIAHVAQCTANAQPDKSLKLPASHSDGDPSTTNIPNIAISTGGADTLECLLRRIGIDASEYTGGSAGPGRIHIFAGGKTKGGGGGGGGGGKAAPNTNPPGPASSTGLWDSQTDLMQYDAVLLSCEGSETSSMNQEALHAYASAGGRVFASHYHYAWFNSGPYSSENLATWSAGSNDLGNINGAINTTFPKGAALSQWLGVVGALSGGELPIQAARHNADVGPSNTPPSQPWIIADSSSSAPGATEYFSFNTPTNAAVDPDSGLPAYCGRVVYSDLHVGAASGDDPTQPVPTECANVNLSPQEDALEFMLFDLSSCVVPDSSKPVPPPIDGGGIH